MRSSPNDLDSLDDLIDRIHAFGERYSALGKLFNWTFTRQELERLLREPLLHLEPSARYTGLLDRPRHFRDSPLKRRVRHVDGSCLGS